MNAAVARSPLRATTEIGAAIVTTYKAYLACAEHYRARGDDEHYIYAIAQCADLFRIAAEDYHALGDDPTAIAILQRGHKVLSEALATGLGIKQFRNDIQESSDEITKMLKRLTR